MPSSTRWAARSKCTDGGIRSGQVVLKAVALGAKNSHQPLSMSTRWGWEGVTKALQIIHKNWT
jgi:isopentenyl diphosphate isomerase/L-lactate dehydrogenase-like FMN-dependent dehydrogenase